MSESTVAQKLSNSANTRPVELVGLDDFLSTVRNQQHGLSRHALSPLPAPVCVTFAL